MTLVASAAAGLQVRIRDLGQTRYEKLLAADAVVIAGEPRPIAATDMAVASTPPDNAPDHLTFRICAEDAQTIGELGVVFGTPELYASISGLSPPGATTANDAYGGWQLP
jgi:hypothetical protein